MKTEINSQLKEFFQEYKKYILLPLAIIPVGLYIYFSFVPENESEEEKSNQKKGISNSTPSASVTSLENNKGYHYDLIESDSISKMNRISKDQNIDLDINKKAPKGSNFYANEEKTLDELERLENSIKKTTNHNNENTNKKLLERIKKLESKSQNISKEPSKKEVIKNPEEEEEEEEEILGWTAPELKYDYKGHKTSSKGETTSGLIKAQIAGTRLKNNMVTKDNPRVRIRTLEPFMINGYSIPKNEFLIAYASFTNELKLKISHINIDDGKDIINCNIEILDSYGQPALEVLGGTGADTQGNISEDIGDDLANSDAVDKIPGGKGLIKSIFKKKTKARVNANQVYLKIN